MNRHEAIEFEKRGVLHFTGCRVNFEDKTLVLESKFDLKKPTKLDFFLAYITLTIPAAMLARVTRYITGRKGTPLERFCMEYYYDQSVKLLRKD